MWCFPSVPHAQAGGKSKLIRACEEAGLCAVSCALLWVLLRSASLTQIVWLFAFGAIFIAVLSIGPVVTSTRELEAAERRASIRERLRALLLWSGCYEVPIMLALVLIWQGVMPLAWFVPAFVGLTVLGTVVSIGRLVWQREVRATGAV
jgi:hypothetical protein